MGQTSPYIPRMALYIFSDAHLGSGTPESEGNKRARITELCELVKRDGDRLIILGDLFDFWFEYNHVIPKAYHEVLFELYELRKQGIAVDYVSGNHDFWMGDFFEKHLGIAVHVDSLELNYAGKRLFLCHGDGLAKADSGYRLLKRIFRNKLAIWLYRKLPPDWAYPLAQRVSGTSRKHTAQRDHEFAADYAAYAEKHLAQGYDVVIIGHLHIPVVRQFGQGMYINTGDFIHHFTYVRIVEEGVSLETLKKP